MKILSIIDSFKGTFTSLEVSNIVKEELEKKGAEVTCIPISDGGEGFLEAYNYINKLPVLEVDTVDPLARPIKAKYLFDKENDFAVIELAQSSGITLIRHDERNPFITSTYGLGLVIKDAINRGAKNILIGIGGSASNDGGSGMLEALGVKFYDKDNNLITSLCNEKLGLIHHIDRKDFQKLTSKIRFDVCSDVTNPLLGENGATYVFAKQKGAKECDLELLENNYFLNKEITPKNEKTGIFKGKNLIIVMIETGSSVLFDYPEYYPNMAKLYNEGWTWTNSFSPRNACSTGNNEMSGITSLYTINRNCTANVYKDNTYFEAIFNLFNNKNY